MAIVQEKMLVFKMLRLPTLTEFNFSFSYTWLFYSSGFVCLIGQA